MTAASEAAQVPDETCPPPPKSGPAAYPRRPGAQRDGERPPVRLELPGEPPRLTPAAARALLQILLKAYAKAMEHPEGKED
jgi:hypothetical protein